MNKAVLGVGIRICYTGVFIDKIEVKWEKIRNPNILSTMHWRQCLSVDPV